MTDEKSHTEQGQIERAQRLRRKIDDLKTGKAVSPPSPKGKSLREQVEERGRAASEKKSTPDSK